MWGLWTWQLQGWDLPAVPNLETLDIHGSTQLPDLSAAPRLKHLRAACAALSALKLSAVSSSLVSLRVNSTSLPALDLTRCTALQELNVWSFIASPALKQLDLSDCVSLQQLKLAHSGVAEVDVSACTTLKEVVIREGQRVVGAGPRVQFMTV